MGTAATITPDSPPMVKMTMKPQANSIGVAKRGRPSQMVAIQQKIWMPDGMAMVLEDAVKKASPSCGRPVANMGCTQSPKLSMPVATSDSTSARGPKIGRPTKVGMMEEMNPVAGMKMM